MDEWSHPVVYRCSGPRHGAETQGRGIASHLRPDQRPLPNKAKVPIPVGPGPTHPPRYLLDREKFGNLMQ